MRFVINVGWKNRLQWAMKKAKVCRNLNQQQQQKQHKKQQQQQVNLSLRML